MKPRVSSIASFTNVLLILISVTSMAVFIAIAQLGKNNNLNDGRGEGVFMDNQKEIKIKILNSTREGSTFMTS